MNEIVLVKEPVKVNILSEIISSTGGDLVKAVIDIRLNIMAIDGEMHSDEEQFLLGQGSNQDDLWGINIYPKMPRNEWIEFDSMINIRPRQNNRSRSVEDLELQKKIIQVVNDLILQ